MKRLLLTLTMAILANVALCATSTSVITFEDLTLAPESYWNGSDVSYGFISGDAAFSNFWDDSWGEYWEGYAYSNQATTTVTGPAAQYMAQSNNGQGGGVDESDNFGLFYDGFYGSDQIVFGAMSGVYSQQVQGMYITNNHYVYDALLNGYQGSHVFGGTTGDDADWFKVSIYGLDSSLSPTSNFVDFYLADYRFEDNSEDYIVDDWTWVDLSSLGTVSGLTFVMSSSDNNIYGMLTPAYFAMDNITTTVPEPATVGLLALGLIALKRR